MAFYKALGHIRIDGRKVKPGEIIELGDDLAQSLAGYIETTEESAPVDSSALESQGNEDQSGNNEPEIKQNEGEAPNEALNATFEGSAIIEQPTQEEAQESAPKAGIFGGLFGGQSANVLNPVQP
jgi:hypothetical protein